MTTLLKPIEPITEAPSESSQPGVRLVKSLGGGTEDDAAFVKYAPTMTARELADRFGMSMHGVRYRALRLNVKFIREKHAWTKRDTWELYTLAEKHGAADIARLMGRPLGTIKKKLTENKLKTRSELYTLETAAENTGYTKDQLLRARNATGQKWVPRGGVFNRHWISPQQLDELCDWLKKEE